MSDIAIIHFVNYKRGTQSRAAMRGVMLYVMQEMKTTWEGGPLISGINCQPQSVYDDFLNTKLLYHKDSGVMFYHMVQSFPKGAAVDPRQAHEAARRHWRVGMARRRSAACSSDSRRGRTVCRRNTAG